MKQLDENTWWKYLDGNCNEKERLQMESLLSENPELAEEMLLRTTLHEQMGDLQLEQPSTNFSANVMAAIPAKKIVISPIEPLIPPKMKRVLVASSSLLLVALISAPFLLSSPSTASTTTETRLITDATQSIGEWMSAILASVVSYLPSVDIPTISDSVMQMSCLLLVGFTILLAFDAMMKKRVSF